MGRTAASLFCKVRPLFPVLFPSPAPSAMRDSETPVLTMKCESLQQVACCCCSVDLIQGIRVSMRGERA